MSEEMYQDECRNTVGLTSRVRARRFFIECDSLNNCHISRAIKSDCYSRP